MIAAHIADGVSLTKFIYWIKQVNKKKITPTKTYTVAVSDYLMKGFDIPFLKNDNPEVIDVYKPKENETSFDIRKAVIEFLKTQ